MVIVIHCGVKTRRRRGGEATVRVAEDGLFSSLLPIRLWVAACWGVDG